MTIGDEDTDASEWAVADRYEWMRSLAGGLASAIGVDEVASVVAERAGWVLGAVGCRVASHDDSTHEVVEYADWGMTSPAGQHLDIWESSTTGTAAGSTFSCRDPRYSAAAFTQILEPGRSIGVLFIWEGSPADEEDLSAVAGLCLAGLQRAWLTRRMRESRPIMDALLDQASIGLAFVDRDLRYVHINERLAGINGRSVSSHRGKTIRQVTPGVADQVEPLLRQVLDTGVPAVEIELTTTVGHDSSPSVFLATYLPVSLDGEVVGVAAVVDDVTEHRRQLEDLKKRYEFERQVATRLQRGLTPRNLPRPEGYEVAVRYSAGAAGLRIGGDWYDLIETAPDRLALVIGDVVGHGLDAAVAMVRIRHALAGLSHALTDPIEIMHRLDDYATDDEDQFVATLVIGILDLRSGQITMSSAGHVPPLLRRQDGATQQLQTVGAPIGIKSGDRDAVAVTMESGDTLVLYTDGVIEDRGEPLDKGLNRLAGLVEQPFETVDQLVDRIGTEATRRDNSDDAAILVLRRRQLGP